MSELESNKAPIWFTVVSVLLLIWNFLGVMAYISQVTMGPEALAALPGDQRPDHRKYTCVGDCGFCNSGKWRRPGVFAFGCEK